MKKRIIALLLALLLLAGTVPSVFAAEKTLEESVDLERIVELCTQIYLRNEGNYDTVVRKDSNSLSIGFIQWHGMNALILLKEICSADPVLSESLLGPELYNEVVTTPAVYSDSVGWKNRILTEEEAVLVKKLLGTQVSIRIQKQMGREEILAEARHAWNAGVRTEGAILYYCSIENQYGIGGVKGYLRRVRQALGLGENDIINSLEEFHKGVLAARDMFPDYSFHVTYRTNVYNFLQNNGLDPKDSFEVHRCPCAHFTDIPDENNWAHAGIDWAYTNHITNGVTKTSFKPKATCTRAEIVTFLWRYAGKPEPAGTENPFEDVRSSSYYYKAVLWAVENGITRGMSKTRFDPDAVCTRSQVVTFLWRANGSPLPAENASYFRDVKVGDYFAKAVNWAMENGITGGTSLDSFSPNDSCSRAEAVAFLHRVAMVSGAMD